LISSRRISLKEGEIISRTLRLSEKPAHYTYLRSSDEMKAFVKEFGRSQHRYSHVSCTVSASAFLTTTGRMSAVISLKCSRRISTPAVFFRLASSPKRVR